MKIANIQWNDIDLSQIQKDILVRIEQYQATIIGIANQEDLELTWLNLIQPLEDARFYVEQEFNILSHIHATQDSVCVRNVNEVVLPRLSALHAELFQNYNLYQKILNFKNSAAFLLLNDAQQKIIQNLLLDFKMSGVELPAEQQQRYKKITTLLMGFSDDFMKNILDYTNIFRYYVAELDRYKIFGLPQHILESLNKIALEKGYANGWLFSLDLPCVEAVLRHAECRELRKIIYMAHVTKSSDIAGQFDNSYFMQEIINLRIELADMLGFNNYCEYSLVHKMAKTTAEVEHFLEEIASIAVPLAKKEFASLLEFARQQPGFVDLAPWDISFYAEQYKKSLFSITEEDIRDYFPINRVLSKIFALANKLFGITVEEEINPNIWHPTVKLYKILDKHDNLLGFFYTDLYCRKDKKSGAWMAEAISRHKLRNQELQRPVAFLMTNFVKSDCLYHDDVLTLLHEFGHVLHHVLTKVDYISVSGCNGVAWDAVELPSQFMEKWGYDWQFIQDMSLHYKTQTKLSKEKFDILLEMKNYNLGMAITRQLEFAMFDFKVHMYKSAKPGKKVTIADVQRIINNIREKVSVIPVCELNKFQHSFSHIFSGGYAAGYYGYYWAEVLACDAIMAFKNQDHKVWGEKFLHNILETGGSKDPMDLYVAFRGQKPDPKALLRDKGLIK